MVQKTSALILSLYRHHIARYLFVGGTTFLIDIGLLYLFHGKLSVPLSLATTLAYWISIVYNFILNRNWTFEAREKEDLKHHFITYFILLGFNYLFTVIFIDIASHHGVNYLIAKVLAVMVQITWTYFIYKNYIFVQKKKPDSIEPA